jgi:hypothetical protein
LPTIPCPLLPTGGSARPIIQYFNGGHDLIEITDDTQGKYAPETGFEHFIVKFVGTNLTITAATAGVAKGGQIAAPALRAAAFRLAVEAAPLRNAELAAVPSQILGDSAESLVATPGGLRQAAYLAHTMAPSFRAGRAIQHSAVAIIAAYDPAQGLTYYATGNSAVLDASQVDALVTSGVPRNNIFVGRRFLSPLESNHAEPILLRVAAARGTLPIRIGISWTVDNPPFSTKSVPCVPCEPLVQESKVVVEK